MSGLAVELDQDGPIPLAARFSCAPGEVLALVGPSGGGKSTILRTIAGAYHPARGRVSVNAEVWFDSATRTRLPAWRRRVGMVFQNYALFPHMSALGNVAAAMGHLPPSGRKARAADLLALVHLEGLEDRRPAELSGGQQQRVAVARALAREPAVLLLDEPFSAVDKSTRQRLYHEIVELRRILSMPVVLVTHDLDEAVMLADRMVALHRGRTLQTGTPQELTTKPVSAEVARLVDLRNVFAGQVAGPVPGRELVHIEWNGRLLEAAPNAAFRAGDAVTWVIPDGFIVPHRRDRPSRGEHENPVAGTIESLLNIGPMAHVVLAIPGARYPLHFSVPAHVARRNGFAPGIPATVSLLAEGIHLMPPEPERPDAARRAGTQQR